MFDPSPTPKARKVVMSDDGNAISITPGDIYVRGDYRIEVIDKGERFRTAEAVVEDISDGPNAGERKHFSDLADLSMVPVDTW